MRRRTLCSLLAVAILVTPVPTEAFGLKITGPTGNWSLARSMISQAIRTAGGLGRALMRPPAPPPLKGPDAIFGLVESPQRIWRYAQDGHAAAVLAGLRRGRYLDLPEVGAQYAELRLRVRDLLFASEKPLRAWDLRALAEDSQTPEELSGVLNYIVRSNLQWRDMATQSVLKWGQGRMRYLRSQQEPQKPPPKRQGPPPPPTPAPSAPPTPAPTHPAPPTGGPQLRVPASWPWLAAAGAWLAAAARTIAAALPPPLLP